MRAWVRAWTAFTCGRTSIGIRTPASRMRRPARSGPPRLATQAAEATSFLEPEILAIPAETLEAFRADPAAENWRHYLGNLLRMKAHTLSPREEEILAMAGEVTRVPRTAFGMLNDADLTFRPIRDEQGREVELTKGRYSAFLESLDRRVRRDAWTSLTEGYEAHRNTLAALLGGSVKRDCFYARVRGYSSALQAALFPNNIPESVFHTLVETVAKRRAAVHRAMELRCRILGLEKLEVYDLYVPLSTAEAPKFAYDEARDTLVDGLAPLGDDYLSAMKQGLDGGGWVDVYESRGKRSGAYSWSTYGTHPYVLMNYQGTLDHLFTLAHEMGHAMHSWYTHREQPYHYSHYPIFLAEVASTTNEAILMDHLLKVTEDPDRRLALLNQYIDQIRGTVVTQVMFADFEQRIHAMVESGEPSHLGHPERRLPRHFHVHAGAGAFVRRSRGARLGADPALLLRLLRLPVRHRIRGRDGPFPARAGGRRLRTGGLPGFPEGRRLGLSHRDPSPRRRGPGAARTHRRHVGPF